MNDGHINGPDYLTENNLPSSAKVNIAFPLPHAHADVDRREIAAGNPRLDPPGGEQEQDRYELRKLQVELFPALEHLSQNKLFDVVTIYLFMVSLNFTIPFDVCVEWLCFCALSFVTLSRGLRTSW